MDGNDVAGHELQNNITNLRAEVASLKAQVPKPSPPTPWWVWVIMTLLAVIALFECSGAMRNDRRGTHTLAPSAQGCA